jgi:hypothetical protein
LAKNPTVVRVTSGEHPGFGRVVLDAPGLPYTVSRDGGHVVISFPDAPILGEPPPTPRNVLAIRGLPGGVELTVPPDANVHTSRIGDKVVVDIDDTVRNRPPLAATRPPKGDKPAAATTGATPPAPVPPAPVPFAPIPFAPIPFAPILSAPRPSADQVAAGGAANVVGRRPGNLPRQAQMARPMPGQDSNQAANAGEVANAGGAAMGQPNRDHPAPPVTTPRPDPAGLDASGSSRPGQKPPDVAAAPGRGDARGPASGAPPARPDAPENHAAESRASGQDTSGLPIAETHAIENAGVASRVEDAAAPAAKSPAETAEIQPEPDPAANRPEERSEPQPDTPPGGQPGAPQAWPVTRLAAPLGPLALIANKARPPSGLPGAAIQVPFTGPVGAALFTRGSDSFVVFDERRPIDLSALRDDPVFGTAVVTLYPAATVIHLTRQAGQSAMLFPAATGWRISLVPSIPQPAALTPIVANGVMTFAAEAPGQVVSITDPRDGGTLLVGTQRVAGQAVLTERRTPEFIMPVTGQGIVIDPLSDAIDLRITQAGFVLLGRPKGLALSPPFPMPAATLQAAGLTRLFEFPRQSVANLEWRARQQAVAAAMASPLTRGPLRHALAESMLGLGLGAETQTLLRITMKDDPREAASPATVGLAAIAALLAGRPNEARDLTDPRLSGTDEVAMWRAIQMAMADEESPAAAAILATTAPLLFTYPAELRQRVMPLAVETMILGGQPEAAAPLLAQREHDPRLAYANALLKQALGDNEAALKLFDAVANTRSTFDHARAAVRAVELRLAMGKLDPKEAADALDARLYAWRGDSRDLALRLRIADLRRQAGDWRGVFTMLRGAKADFPGQAAEVNRRLKEAYAAVPRDPALDKMPPTELIALLDENSELLADGSDGEPMRALLAEKLMALDLPKRADPLLTKLMRAAPYGPARAGFGATLATLRLREGDGDGALLALSESNSADMGDAVRERRALITARVEAERGHIGGAIEALADSQTPAADEARAAILEKAQDWPAARDALSVLAAHVVPDSGTLNDAQLRIMLRLATAATRAGDDATLEALREKLRSRLGTGPQADLFRLLTAEPVRGTADLGRARTELGLARAVTENLGPKKPAAKTP